MLLNEWRKQWDSLSEKRTRQNAPRNTCGILGINEVIGPKSILSVYSSYHMNEWIVLIIKAHSLYLYGSLHPVSQMFSYCASLDNYGFSGFQLRTLFSLFIFIFCFVFMSRVHNYTASIYLPYSVAHVIHKMMLRMMLSNVNTYCEEHCWQL